MANLNINPWKEIWVHPKKTMRAILDWNPRKYIIGLVIIAGLLAGFTWAATLWHQYPDKAHLKSFWFVIILAVAGAIFALINLYFSGWLYRLTGSWIGGKGNFTQVKSAVGWSTYPFIFANIFAILAFFASKNVWLSGLFSLINLVLAVWGIVILVNLIGEAHRFSAWKGFLTVIIAAALIFILIMLILLIIPLLTPLFGKLVAKGFQLDVIRSYF